MTKPKPNRKINRANIWIRLQFGQKWVMCGRPQRDLCGAYSLLYNGRTIGASHGDNLVGLSLYQSRSFSIEQNWVNQ